jgi:hypothetical protein
MDVYWQLRRLCQHHRSKFDFLGALTHKTLHPIVSTPWLNTTAWVRERMSCMTGGGIYCIVLSLVTFGSWSYLAAITSGRIGRLGIFYEK